jgi:membrane-bound lytic murein transglycosylase F
MDWRYFKAQAVAESRLRKKARSHDGAIGIMQILPETFKYIRSKNPSIPDDPWNPEWNIAAAIYYDRLL